MPNKNKLEPADFVPLIIIAVLLLVLVSCKNTTSRVTDTSSEIPQASEYCKENQNTPICKNSLAKKP